MFNHIVRKNQHNLFESELFAMIYENYVDCIFKLCCISKRFTCILKDYY